MAYQKFVNNFTSQFSAAVKASPTSGTPSTELDYGILRLPSSAATALTTLTGGDYYILTAFKQSGSVESAVEIMKVTAIDTSVINETRITVTRGFESTTIQSYVAGDYISMRFTAAGATGMAQTADLAAKEPTVTAGTTSQFWRGDKAWTDFATTVRATVLTGLSTATNAAIAATDTLLAALGKLQAQLNGVTSLTGLLKSNGTAVSAATAGTDYLAPPTGTAIQKANSGGALVSAVSNTDYLPPVSPTVSSGNLNFSTTSQRITGDFTNATVASRLMFQTTTTNGSSLVEVIPNGTPSAGTTGGGFVASENSDPANGAVAQLYVIRGQEVRLASGQRGTGTNLPMTFVAGGAVRMTLATSGAAVFAGGVQETRTAMGANNVDLAAGNYFSKTISGTTTLTVSNVPSSGTTASFILDLINGGSATITWWSGVKWAGGTAPTLTAAGRDVLGFFTHDGGTTWTGLVLGKDVK